MIFQLVLLISLISLISIPVNAVFAGEAFVKDWYTQQVGSLNPQNIHFNQLDSSINLLTESGVFTRIDSNGEIDWRLKFDHLNISSPQFIKTIKDKNQQLLVALNYNDQFSNLQIFNPTLGFLIDDSVATFDQRITFLETFDDSILVILFNGDVVILNFEGEIKSKFNLVYLKSNDNVQASVLNNHNIIITYEKDSKINYVFYKDNTEEINPFSFHELQIPFDSIKEFVGTKIIYEENDDYYAININKLTGDESKPWKFPKFDKFIPIESSNLLAFEKNHNIEIYSLEDGFIKKFEIINVHKYQLLFNKENDLFTLITEFHIRLIDSDSGLELISYFIGSGPLQFDSISSISSISNIETNQINTILHFKNETYKALKNDEELWTQDWSLSNILSYTIVNIEEELTFTKDEIFYEEGLNILDAYVFRVKEHLNELYEAYDGFWEFLTKYFEGDYQYENSNDKVFGFIKYLIVGTKSGQVSALNISNGDKVWSFNTDLINEILEIENINNQKVKVYTKSGNVFVLDSLTGELKNNQRIASPLNKVIKLDDSSQQHLLELESGFDVILSENQTIYNENIFFTKHNEKSIQGYRIYGKSSFKTWEFKVNSDDTIVGISQRDPDQKVSNIGYVLGNKDVLYKYLYPNVAAFGVYDSKSSILYVHIIDIITGELLYSTHHDEVVSKDSFNIVFGEHWVVYSYYSKFPVPEQKIVVLDLFESLTPNERISKEIEISSFENKILPKVSSKSFIIPFKINSIGLSNTRFGVTTKSIILFLNNQLAVIPKFILNSRRVEGRDLDAIEKSEPMLLPYDPIITIDDSEHVISHERELLGIEEIISVPTNIESNSIVCAFGLDIFCTRITPSNEFDRLSSGFDKGKLIISILVLIVLNYILKPIISSRELKNQWIVES
ncbi:hypothetical protein WICMUC_001648 [Wickerhamomyces mucosus]|uniref:ER membrane protein complex subunit 1 n=1 Tax=Wickerhamomyces mucosus TaxID=1378264 RepID=A0A9P8PVM5_9ASCO|nr:hypothetical protein WICMUC_001648 [Wickerhamomyces mucosus]